MKIFKKYLEIIQEMKNIKDMSIQELLLNNVGIGGNEKEKDVVKYYKSTEDFIDSKDILYRINYRPDVFAGMIFRFIIEHNERYYYFRLQSDTANIYEDDSTKKDIFSDNFMLSGFSISKKLIRAILYIEDIEPLILISTKNEKKDHSFEDIEKIITQKIKNKSIDNHMKQQEEKYLNELTPEKRKKLEQSI